MMNAEHHSPAQANETQIDTNRSQFAPVGEDSPDKKGLLEKEENASIEEPLMPTSKPRRDI